MKLYYPVFDEKIKTLEEKMIEMVVSHKLIFRKKLNEPTLEFGEDRVEGVDKIMSYLEDLHRDIQKGYFCGC
ncbi:MAG: hypothetical protein P8M17_05715 [Saprospiraceae bacterium]|nr:hypothetical protein [Saprospiraceae bacterium]MDC3219904.1 hypothetical protein [Saprospiraceae bacterium]MDG1432445.1 hypothetical protein [Saprospiraceae bacterium]MDG2418468.1 hypothetical protein [Saprospiraceae bacterium]